MKQVIVLKLEPAPSQHAALLSTLDAFNAGAQYAADVAYEKRLANKIALQPLVYGELRARFGLSSQMAVRAISKAVEAYKRDKRVHVRFKPHGAMVYDERIMSFKGLTHVSLLTVAGRQWIPIRFGAYQQARIERTKGQADLLYRDGTFFLCLTIDLPTPPVSEPEGFLGVDLGIKNIAADSDGTLYAGGKLRRYRKRSRRLRRRLQAVCTRGARRLLAKRRRTERRHATQINHGISKKIVAAAKGTGRGVAVEELTGIRDRTTVRRANRAEHSGWAFHQLRFFLEYKCAAAGVPFVAVDARNTSRTCPRCGCVDKRNRPSQAEFRCTQCALEGHADLFAAQEVARRATVSWPNCRAGEGPLERTPKCAQGKTTPLGVSAMPPALEAG
jgi:putative transposase